MSNEKKILDFDNKELFISNRILRFILDNARATILVDNFPNTIERYKEDIGMNQNDVTKKFEIRNLVKLIKICQMANRSAEQFYSIGYHMHELHIIVSSYINPRARVMIDWKKETNLFSLRLKELDNKITLCVELNKILFLDYHEYVKPIQSILKGFLCKIFSIIFESSPLESATQNGFILSHSLSGIVQFDHVKFISEEQYVFSRIKNYLSQEDEKSLVGNIKYYLYKDIKFSIDEIASKLNLSVRSLQRNLKEEENSFREIKEKIRKELSLQYLQDFTITIDEVCLLLGYSERSAFEKAFKKWHNRNAAEYRKSLR